MPLARAVFAHGLIMAEKCPTLWEMWWTHMTCAPPILSTAYGKYCSTTLLVLQFARFCCSSPLPSLRSAALITNCVRATQSSPL